VTTVQTQAREGLIAPTDRGTGSTFADPRADSATFCRRHRRHLVNRYYDPASYQFISVDPKVGTTLEPYAFVGGDPLNATDPLGLFRWRHFFNPCDWGNACRHAHNAAKRYRNAVSHSTFEHDVVDIPQDASYLQYWATYAAIKTAKRDASHVPGGSAVVTGLSLPLVPIEVSGLAGQALGSLSKGQSIWQQDQGNQPLFGQQTGGVALSKGLAQITGSNKPLDMTFPGFNYYHPGTVDIEW
jgi:RHS repeat-associated protein